MRRNEVGKFGWRRRLHPFKCFRRGQQISAQARDPTVRRRFSEGLTGMGFGIQVFGSRQIFVLSVLWVTDLVSPRGPVGRNPGTVAVGEALRKHNITGATIAGGHGATTKQAEIAPALAAN